MSKQMSSYEINRINFGIMSSEDIKKLSVCEINNPKLTGPNSVYDEKLGTLDNNKKCIQCKEDNKKCPGHFGHIVLHYPIIHPLYFKHVINFLKCFCLSCHSLMFTEDQLKLDNIMSYSKKSRFNKILEKLEKTDICPNCSQIHPKIIYVASESTIYKDHKTKNESHKTQLSENEIFCIFDRIKDSDIKLLGLAPKYTHPRNLIIEVLPVLPPVARPYIIADNLTCDDDLTIQYVEIIKLNNLLADTELAENKKIKHIQSIKFRIKCLFDNSQEKQRHTNGRPIKGIKKRLAGKEGQIRNNLMGKRVDKSARSVIGPDPTLRLNEIAVPRKIGKILTIPERVNNYNISKLTTLVNNNQANFIIKHDGKTRINLQYALFRKGTELLYGDVIKKVSGQSEVVGTYFNYILKPGDKIIRNGEELKDIKYMEKKKITLNIGDIVERHLRDGDILLLNRQPTLHKGSMIAQVIKLRDAKTIRMNLAITKTFNADFDGDEMNLHAPASPEEETELRYLSSVQNVIISAQSSKANITIVQDALIGNYLMTCPNQKLTKEWFFQICMSGDGNKFTIDNILKKIQKIRKVMRKFGKKVQAFNGRGLFSLCLPDGLLYEKKNNANTDEKSVKIYDGVLYEGVINKGILGGSHNSLIQIINKEYGNNECIDFINNVQFIANAWLLYHGFSVGIADCIATKSDEINAVVTRCFVEAKGVEETTSHEFIREVKINAALSRARDNGMRIAKEALDKDNNFISTVTSGSKGDFFNIAQITGLLGQQNFSGQRIQPTLNNNTRTLPHYPFEIKDKETEYESKGFIKNSFIRGIDPREFFPHAITGREGVTDTAMKTAQTGYIQRRMVKLGEDVQIKSDGTVRNATGSIYQFNYGNDGLDSEKVVIVNGKPQICDINRIINHLNFEYETTK